MKKTILLVLAVILALSVIGCKTASGDEPKIPKETPTMTVTYGDKTITVKRYTNSWSYVAWGGKWTGYVQDSMDPLEDKNMVTLEVTKDDIEKYGLTATLHFDFPPTKLNDTVNPAEDITFELQEGVHTYYAEWEIPDMLKGECYYAFNCSIQQ